MNFKKIKDKITKSYQYNFGLDIPESEADSILATMVNHMQEVMSKLPGYSEKKFDNYLSGSTLDLSYSPGAIRDAILRVISNVGEKAFKSQNKYRRAREMSSVAAFALAYKKLTGEEWRIYAQDSPDIRMIKVSDRNVNTVFLDTIPVEVMVIPQIEKEKWKGDLSENLINFIKEKKFNKRYGAGTVLLVAIEFSDPGVRFDQVSKGFAKQTNNPFVQIWMGATSADDFTKQAAFIVYPSLGRIDVDWKLDAKGLWY